MCSLHDPLWTTADVAAFLSVPVQTIYDWRTRGYGPPGFRLGKHLRFRESDVFAWLDRMTRPVLSDAAPPAGPWGVGRGVGVEVAGRVVVPSAGLVSRLRWCASDDRAGRANGMGGPDRA
jgi:excisionase family DNA binding protein